jgi:signal transduction histidine kinase
MVGRPEGLVFALLSALMLVVVAVANVSAPTNVTIGLIGLAPILACAWFLSNRFTITLALIAMALRVVVYLVTNGDQVAVLAELAGICVVAVVGRLAAVAVVHWVQVEERADSLSLRSEKATQLERSKSDFLRLASHELRGPVAVLQGYLSMLGDGSLGELPPAAQSVVPLLSDRVSTINHLIEQMLESARLEDSRLELNREDVALDRLVLESLDGVRYLASKEHKLLLHGSDCALTVRADRARLEAIVGNLVSNAIKYSPKGGEVKISVRSAGDHAQVTVQDHGLGIHADDLGKLFTRFGRIHRDDTASISGTGLGLWLSRELARMHGGDVTVRSEVGKGSTFTLSIPLPKAESQAAPSVLGVVADRDREHRPRPEVAR